MANPILPQSPEPAPIRKGLRKWSAQGLPPGQSGNGHPADPIPSDDTSPAQGEYAIAKVGKVYFVCYTGESSRAYRVRKTNGRIVCDCRDFRQDPGCRCEHIQVVIRYVGNSGRSEASSEQEGLAEITKSCTTWLLEYPFRSDQIKQKDGLDYIDGAAVLQRLNDVLGPANWSFRILDEPVDLRNEILIRGRLTARIDGLTVVKEDFGAHEYTRPDAPGPPLHVLGDTIKSAVTDCIKRCAHQLGVGLHLYSRDGKYRSFHINGFDN